MDHTPLGNGSHEPIYVPPCRLSPAAVRRKDEALAALDAQVASDRPLDGCRPRALTTAEYRAAIRTGAAAAAYFGERDELARWQTLRDQARTGPIRSPSRNTPRARARAKRSRAGSAGRSGGGGSGDDGGGGSEPPPQRRHEAAVLLDVVELEADLAPLQAALARLALAWLRVGRTP